MAPNKSLKNAMKNTSVLEICLIVLIVVYLLSPIRTPSWLVSMIESPLGMVAIFGIVAFLFLYCNIVLAILFVFVVYVMLYRSSGKGGVGGRVYLPDGTYVNSGDNLGKNAAHYIQYTPNDKQREQEMQNMNAQTDSASKGTLEIEVVQNMAPLHKVADNYMETQFKPVADNIHQAQYYGIGTYGSSKTSLR